MTLEESQGRDIHNYHSVTDFLSAIQVTIQLTDHLAIRHILAIRIQDVSGNCIPTVINFHPICEMFNIEVSVDRFLKFFSFQDLSKGPVGSKDQAPADQKLLKQVESLNRKVTQTDWECPST